jgi:hypothetical protein
MHSARTITAALALADEGANACEISQLLGIPRTTARDWLRGHLPHHVAGTKTGMEFCGRCGHTARGFANLSEAYVYLLGLYLGDGSIAQHHRGVHKLRIFLGVKYPAIIALTDIRAIFCRACDRLEVRWTAARTTIYISRKPDVARLRRVHWAKAMTLTIAVAPSPASLFGTLGTDAALPILPRQCGDRPAAKANPSPQRSARPPPGCGRRASAWPTRGGCGRFPGRGTGLRRVRRRWRAGARQPGPRARGE